MLRTIPFENPNFLYDKDIRNDIINKLNAEDAALTTLNDEDNPNLKSQVAFTTYKAAQEKINFNNSSVIDDALLKIPFKVEETPKIVNFLCVDDSNNKSLVAIPTLNPIDKKKGKGKGLIKPTATPRKRKTKPKTTPNTTLEDGSTQTSTSIKKRTKEQ